MRETQSHILLCLHESAGRASVKNDLPSLKCCHSALCAKFSIDIGRLSSIVLC